MNYAIAAASLLVLNLGILWLLMAAPIGLRTIRIRRHFDSEPNRIWEALYPLGKAADWHPSVLSSHPLPGEPGLVERSLSHLDRKGRPIVRRLAVEKLPGAALAYEARIVEDSALDPSFWQAYVERTAVTPSQGGCEVTIEHTDRYRGLAFMIFRYFAMRREIRALGQWLKSGRSSTAGLFEHPLTQTGMAILSTLILWPFFGLHPAGLMLSTMLTVVIVIHELGHMAAYRAFGHTSARMIFIPLLGGVAIGGRPYDTRFEVATCALLGAGMSALLFPVAVLFHQAVEAGWLPQAFDHPALMFLLILGAFNLLNLLPMSRFDGGQIIRQLFDSKRMLVTASFGIACVILWIGYRIDLPQNALLAGMAVFTLVSLLGTSNVKPRFALDEMRPAERLMAGFGLYAALFIHGYAVIYACDRLFV
jgi:Zn-dependent protease